jgi:RpiB/LacA/LacB family sugar-phosphate isomerase
MRIAVGCDDAGFPVKPTVIAALESEGHVILDLGSFSAEPVDYPDYARAVGQAVLRGFADAGVLLCDSGVGAAIAANKLPRVRAAFCPDVLTARLSREQADANVLCLAAGAVEPAAAVDIARTWIGTRFPGVEPHARRVAKIAGLEDLVPGAEKVSPPSPAREPGHVTMPPTGTPPPRLARATAEAGASLPDRSSGPRLDEARTDAPAPTAARARRRSPDALQAPVVDETLAFLEAQGFLDRLWTKDTSLWKGDPAQIAAGLGWLTAPTIMRAQVDNLRTFADEIRRLQFSQVVVLGAGAAALCTEVFAGIFGSKMGFPDLLTMDSTDPSAIRRRLDPLNVSRTLFVVSSKSGTTAETLALYHACRERVEATGVTKPGMQFVAITDPMTPLCTLARESGFRHTFLNHPSIGGRFAVLSYFGLVPASLIGVDLKSLLDRARAMAEECGNSPGAHDSAPARLGAALAAFARHGRDKVTLVLSEKIHALGAWIEHLLAESLGKDGTGLVPVVDEPLGDPDEYRPDRVFVAVSTEGDASHEAALEALAAAGHPVIRLDMEQPLDVGAEFFRWQVAVATAGAILGVNPFDEPDVGSGTQRTEQLLSTWKKIRRFPDTPPDAEQDGIALRAGTSPKPASVGEGIMTHLAQAGPADYLALQAYVEPTPETARALGTLRLLLRDRLRIATTLGFGPRYLHATGQLHKGGPPTGLFIQITAADDEDLDIPGAGYGFSALKTAQALGDAEALRERGRRVLRLHLTGNPAPALSNLVQLARAATRKL